MTADVSRVDREIGSQSAGVENPKRSASAVADRGFRLPNLFGTSLRADILALIAALDRTYPRELARALDRPVSLVQRGVADLERAGVVVTRLRGNQREVSLNRDYVAANELSALLHRLLETDDRLRRRLVELGRRRPRRAGKPT